MLHARSRPSHSRALWLGAVLVLLGAARSLPAQELSILGGVMDTQDHVDSSYSWQVEYRQDIYRNLAASIAVINEGHVPGHHRDGTAWEAWGRLPFADNRFAVAVGVGEYYYFDTVLLPDGTSADIHGAAPIYSFSATAYVADRWSLRFMANRISPAHDIKVNTVAVGVGYWFGQDRKPTPGKLGDAPGEKAHVTDNELTLFGGQSVVNTFLSQSARAYAAEYRRGVMPHLDATASLIYEGDPEIIRRSGLALQLWGVNTFFHDRISVGAGLGPYIYLDHKNPVDPAQRIPASVAPLASLTLSARLSEHWRLRLVFDRVMSNYNRDADIFLGGLSCVWPR
jgi:hypothetical protein